MYCGGCGARIGSDPGSGSFLQTASCPALPGQGLAVREKAGRIYESERKNVTVLFADISGSMAMCEKLDPEEVTHIMNECLKVLADCVNKYEGYVDKFIGDCIMAIFGAPITHENDPELALQAALEMKKEIEEYNKTLTVKLEKPLTLHIGINTGPVIAGGVGSDNKMEYTVMGDTVNLASRLESIAGSRQIFISGYTYNLTRDLFDFVRHEPIKIKGKKEPVAIYELIKAKPVQERKNLGKIVPLVGRRHELSVLKGCAKRFVEGYGQVITLMSDPGIGKSRIQMEVKKQFKEVQVQIIEGIGKSFNRSTGYSLFSDIFKSLFNIDSEDSEDSVAEKISNNLPILLGLDQEMLSAEIREAIVFIGNLMGVDLSPEYDIPLPQMEAQEIRMSTFRSVAWFFKRLSHFKPLLLVFENLHYSDNTSVELIAYLFEVLKDDAIMILLLMRPIKDHPCSKLSTIARKVYEERSKEILFKRLKPSECDEFVRNFMQSEDVPEGLYRLIRERGDGNPLYIEEIIRSLLDEGLIERTSDGKVLILKDLDKITMPSSIQGVIMARIDRLPSALKDTLHAAAVIGPVFKHTLIERVAYAPDIDERLNELEELGLIIESRSFPEIEYSFRSILIQEAIYSILLHKKQKELHLRVADEIERLYEERLEDYFEVLAHHHLKAGNLEKAYQYTAKTGMKAKENFSNEDAAEFLLRAIDLAKGITVPLAERKEIYIALSEVKELMGDMDGAIEAWKNAMVLMEDKVEKADAIRNIGRIHEKRGSKETALQVYEDAYAILKDHPEAVETGMLYMNQSWVLNRLRQHDVAIQKAMNALEIFERYGDQEKIAHLCNNLAVIYEHTGNFEKALEFNHRSYQYFLELGNKRQIGNIYLSLGYLHNKMNELETALDYFDKSFESMDRIGNRFGTSTALMSKGRCCIDLNMLDEAERVLLQALGIHRDLDLKRKIVANEIALCNVYLRNGDILAARAHLAGARKIAVEQNYVSDLAKTARLEARLLIKEGKNPDNKFKEAIDRFKEIGRNREAEAVSEECRQYVSVQR